MPNWNIIGTGLAIATLAGTAAVAFAPGLFQNQAREWFWIASVASGAGLLMAAYGAFAREKKRESIVTEKRNGLGEINVNMGNDNAVGHIGHVVNEAPLPEFEYVGTPTVTTNSDGTISVSLLFDIVAPYPPGQLQLKVFAQGIRDLEVNPMRAGMSMTGHSGQRENMCFTTLMSPFGRYQMRYRARGNDLFVEYIFN